MSDEIVVYQPDEVTRIEPRFDGETVWLTQKEIAELFGRNVKTISRHLKEAEKEELAGLSTFSNFEIVAADGKTRTVKCYNLDAVLSVGYRVKSPRGVQFRQWASKGLKERILRQSQQNALQGRLEALEQKMARLTGEALPCAPAPSCTAVATPDANPVRNRDAVLVSLMTKERINYMFRNARAADNSVIFIRDITIRCWFGGVGITPDDVRNLVECGENKDFLPNYYTLPVSDDDVLHPGMLYVGRNVSPTSFNEVIVVGGRWGTILKRVTGQHTYGIVGRLALRQM